MKLAVAALLLAAVAAAGAQESQSTAPQVPVAAPAPAQRALQPFVASYEVHRDGKVLGDATLQLVDLPAGRWRVDLGIRGTRGLAGLAGLNLQQSTLFDVVDGRYRPLSQSTVRKMVFRSRRTTGTYDWARGVAQWQGDVKETRRGEVPLQPGDMSGLLINLAVQRDAVPGTALHYRFVDDGRVRQHQYLVDAEREPVEVDGLGYSAMRVTRAKAAGESTTLWVTEGVPMPVRILTIDDEDEIDLRLVDYR